MEKKSIYFRNCLGGGKPQIWKCAVWGMLLVLAAFLLCGTDVACLADADSRQSEAESSFYVYADSEGSLTVDFHSEGAKVMAVKSDNKNLWVKLVHQCDSDFEIKYYAQKSGSYMIAVTIQTENGKSSQRNIKVIAETYPIKKAVYGNKKIDKSGVQYTKKKTGELSIQMKKGYTLKKIYLGVKKQGKKIVYKRIKNHSKIALGKLYELYSGSAVVKVTYISSDSAKKKNIYLHIYKI